MMCPSPFEVLVKLRACFLQAVGVLRGELRVVHAYLREVPSTLILVNHGDGSRRQQPHRLVQEFRGERMLSSSHSGQRFQVEGHSSECISITRRDATLSGVPVEVSAKSNQKSCGTFVLPPAFGEPCRATHACHG
jgi:hypothetical protein